jgi:adenine deaminase
VGTSDEDIYTAINRIKELQGGLVVCADGKILAELPLPIAGLLSYEVLKTVVSKHDAVEKAAATLGNVPQAPFAVLSFLALPVIPELKLTDLGLVDVLSFKIIS